MMGRDSILDAGAMAEARALLSVREPVERIWPVLAAATALTLASIVFAAAMILAPPVTTEHVAKAAP